MDRVPPHDYPRRDSSLQRRCRPDLQLEACATVDVVVGDVAHVFGALR